MAVAGVLAGLAGALGNSAAAQGAGARRMTQEAMWVGVGSMIYVVRGYVHSKIFIPP